MAQKRFKAKSKAIAKEAPPPKQSTRLQRGIDWASTWGPLILALAGILAFFIFASKNRWNQSIDARLSSWREAYNLDTQTVERFREIELQFHGSGNPFIGPISHTPNEVKIHHEEMAHLMDSDAGNRFLHDLQKGRWDH